MKIGSQSYFQRKWYGIHLNNGLPLPEQDIQKVYSNYSNDYSNLHNETQIQTNTSKQNMGFLSTKRTIKDNQEQAVPYPAFGTIIK
jgi:hypothetical protein